MADYKELLRRAIEALPENNGAARRAVYEKARSALVTQLRAIDPPLPAREITQHRLQLEDSIRQVEQEASEAVIAGLKQQERASAPPPAVVEPPPPQREPDPEPVMESEPEPAVEPEPVAAPAPVVGAEEEIVDALPAPEEAEEPAPLPEPADDAEEPERVEMEASEPEGEEADEPHDTIEDIIAAEDAAAHHVEAEAPEPVIPTVKAEPGPFPAANDDRQAPVLGGVTSLVARAEATKSAPSSPLTFRSPRPFANPVNPVKGPTFEPRRDGGNVVAVQRIEPAAQQIQAVARQVSEPLAVVEQPSVALSTVREVEVEPVNDPQKAIDRAIETLDREARGESTSPNGTTTVEVNRLDTQSERALGPDSVRDAEAVAKAASDDSFDDDDKPRRGGGSAVTIFLLVFVLLLAGAGAAGYWAWREGYVDPATMFGQGAPAVADTATNTLATPSTPTLSENAPAPVANNTATTPANNTAETDVAEAQSPVDNRDSAPGNTAPSENAVEPTQELKSDDRLLPENDVIAAETNQPTSPATEGKDDERLPNGNATGATPALGDPALDAATLAGSQSLLLEASDDGTTGAVPFTGTVEWSEGKDETGLPTLIGKANIPARNLGVDVLIRKNSDPSLPASHLMEVNFNVSETFMGGSIAGLPGVLLKNEELVQGTPLVGASARVVGNSFLFALSSSPDDSTTNSNLLTTRKWMDLALIYATGKRAIITLEKDDAATALFNKVFAEWGKSSPETPAPAPTPASNQG